jgi:hypothetical protein
MSELPFSTIEMNEAESDVAVATSDSDRSD